MARRGQVAIYLIMVLLVAMILALLNVDAFTAVRAKRRLQNGGDAAALAAARVQGELIDRIGHLNLEHVFALIDGDAERAEAIVLEQRRLALLGPLRAVTAASDAAEANGLPKRASFSAILLAHAQEVRSIYAGGGGAGEPYPEPYEDAWKEYADLLTQVAAPGLAAGPDNIEFHDMAGGHLLLDRDFYHAVAGRDWCWFHFNCPGLLSTYHSWRDWGPLPMRGREGALDNSEVFSLHLETLQCALTNILDVAEIVYCLDRHHGVKVKPEQVTAGISLVGDPEQVWFMFEQRAWGKWFEGRRLVGEEEGEEFPVVGEVKDEYNVRGCAAVCRCENDVASVATDTAAGFTWSAAAKPFGFLVEDVTGRHCPVTDVYRFVVPAMSDVRLVPVDSVGGSQLCTADFGWIVHVREHLPIYMERGATSPGCWWCAQLATWELDSFREAGAEWLKNNSETCVRQTGGGTGRGGGTSRGH